MANDGELVNLALVEQILMLLAVGLPVAGLLAGLSWGWRTRRTVPGAVQGLVCGLLGPAIWVLWRMYNAIEDHYGLDSVKGLLINLALFVTLGASLGVVVGWWRRRETRVESVK